MNYKDEFKLAYTNKYGETMTLKLDNKNNILIKHDDISATSNFVPLNREFFKNWSETMSFEEVNALDKFTDLLNKFSRQRYLGLYDKYEVECSKELDLVMQYQSE
jgi:hypothetical protein